MASGPDTDFVFGYLNDECDLKEVGDSGDELGEGSVREESTVDIVVVGEDSLDSKVEVEPRRMIEDEAWLKLFVLLSMLDDLLDGWVNAGLACRFDPFPNTEAKEGRVPNTGELVDTGILVSCKSVAGEALFIDVYCRSETETIL
ncbi:MAG: hypothetical protein Q9163_001514 [Psora crenata]